MQSNALSLFTSPRARLRARRGAYGLAAMALAAVTLPGAASAAPESGVAGPVRSPDTVLTKAGSSDDPVDYAVAVDESASLAAGELDREKDAVSTIAVSEPSARSRMVVYGFADATTDEQSPVDEVCPMRQLDAVGRDKIGECAATLRRRTAAEGSGTDFISAVRQGVTRLKEAADPDRPRVLFLLTDGHLDIEDSYRYRGLDPTTRDDQADQDLAQALQEAKDAKVQIWPLGFGHDVDEKRLEEMAAAGYRDGCRDLPQTRPEAETVPGAEQLGQALQAAFAAARCLHQEPGTQGRPPGDLHVRVSPLATEGTIVVSKGDPAVRATYYDPQGRKITESGDGSGDGDGGSSFEFTARGKAVESLRITRPLAGRWRVHLDAPEGHRDRVASISALWRGAVRSDIRLEKPSPRAGERTRVEVEVLTRDSVKLDERDLRGISVTGRLTGDGFSQKVPITLTDNGTGPDDQGSDGVFSGTVTVPGRASGSLLFSSTVTSVGLSPDTRSYPTAVSPENSTFEAELDIPAAGVHPGGRVPGTLKVSNRGSAPHEVLLSVADAKGTGLSVTPARVTVEPGASTVPVTVEVAAADELGAPVDDDGIELGGKVVAVEGERVLDDAPLAITVTPVPGDLELLWDRWWKVVIPAAFALAVVVAVLLSRRRVNRLRIAPAGLLLELRDTDSTLVGSGKAKTGRGNWYEFDVVDTATDNPRIVRRSRGTYAVRRGLNGGVVLRISGQGERTLRFGEAVPLEGSLSLHVAESKGRRPSTNRGTRSRSPEKRRTARPAPAGPSADSHDNGAYPVGVPDPGDHPDL
ncbi:VWA domain-containing protein [Streptomyces sp. NPDC096132]|uniref:VWA domain-containing protein n=1 Tax=Streptomyces sp. NPDC096132 TaxID=3366075 RepID=UPI00382D0C40